VPDNSTPIIAVLFQLKYIYTRIMLCTIDYNISDKYLIILSHSLRSGAIKFIPFGINYLSRVVLKGCLQRRVTWHQYFNSYFTSGKKVG